MRFETWEAIMTRHDGDGGGAYMELDEDEHYWSLFSSASLLVHQDLWAHVPILTRGSLA